MKELETDVHFKKAVAATLKPSSGNYTKIRGLLRIVSKQHFLNETFSIKFTQSIQRPHFGAFARSV